jgi:hypothetical protein
MRDLGRVAGQIAVGLVVALAARSAAARRGIRPLFEPTDLELEDPGDVEADVQVGGIRSQGPWRVVVPDFELDVGITRKLELDLDGAYAIEGAPSGPFSFDHAAPDNLWPCAKVGLVDWADDDAPDPAHPSPDAWALGAQAGPKLPVATGTHGIGVEGLLLVGHVVHRTHLVLNAGAFVDPGPAPGASRPVGLELGLDLEQDLDAAGRYALTAELAGVHFLSADPEQLLATAGFAWNPTPDTQVSLVGLVGFLDGSDRYGALVGLSQKFHVWR